MYGRNLINNSTVYPTRVSSDGSPVYKTGGVTLDWATVTAPGSDTTLPDNSIVLSGRKYLRFGQVITKITQSATAVVTINGTPTGGTFTVTATINGVAATTTGIAYNAAASAVQTAIQALSNVGAGNATVTGSTGGPYTLVFASSLGTVAVTSSGASLTGGTTPSATTSTTASGTSFGKFGPYDPNATDGRQTLSPGTAYVLDETFFQYGGTGVSTGVVNDQIGSAIEGGSVWRARILQSEVAAHSLALGPTFAEIVATFPNFFYV